MIYWAQAQFPAWLWGLSGIRYNLSSQGTYGFIEGDRKASTQFRYVIRTQIKKSNDIQVGKAQKPPREDSSGIVKGTEVGMEVRRAWPRVTW